MIPAKNGQYEVITALEFGDFFFDQVIFLDFKRSKTLSAVKSFCRNQRKKLVNVFGELSSKGIILVDLNEQEKLESTAEKIKKIPDIEWSVSEKLSTKVLEQTVIEGFQDGSFKCTKELAQKFIPVNEFDIFQLESEQLDAFSFVLLGKTNYAFVKQKSLLH